MSVGRLMSHFSVFAFEPAFWEADPDARERTEARLRSDLAGVAESMHVYTTFGTRPDGDLLVWSSLRVEAADAPARFFERFAELVRPIRSHVRLVTALWGFTRESEYATGSTERAIDSMRPRSRRYLVVYPFAKTPAWYATPSDERRRMMSEHIRVGRSHPGVEQQLLYCMGLQDHEFVVVYETDDLVSFTTLVSDLRSTEGRAYTLLDAPVFVGILPGTPGQPG